MKTIVEQSERSSWLFAILLWMLAASLGALAGWIVSRIGQRNLVEQLEYVSRKVARQEKDIEMLFRNLLAGRREGTGEDLH